MPDPYQLQKDIWKRIAFCTRYGRIGLKEALDMEAREASEFLEALGELIEQENTVHPGD